MMARYLTLFLSVLFVVVRVDSFNSGICTDEHDFNIALQQINGWGLFDAKNSDLAKSAYNYCWHQLTGLNTDLPIVISSLTPVLCANSVDEEKYYCFPDANNYYMSCTSIGQGYDHAFYMSVKYMNKENYGADIDKCLNEYGKNRGILTDEGTFLAATCNNFPTYAKFAYCVRLVDERGTEDNDCSLAEYDGEEAYDLTSDFLRKKRANECFKEKFGVAAPGNYQQFEAIYCAKSYGSADKRDNFAECVNNWLG